MNTLKPCPFCGGKNVLSTELQDGLPFIAYCQCGAENEAENWNTRPIEDELQKRIAELESDNDALKTENAELKERIGFLELNAIVYSSGQMANIARIAELEAMVEELKPYRDGYDGEFLEPTDDRFYLIRHTSGQLVTWRKVDNHEDINFLGWGAKGKPRRYWRLPEVQE